MRRRKHRGISLGTITMLTLTALVLLGFFALLPSFTGQADIRLNAAELVVAIDQSFSQLASTTTQLLEHRPQTTALPPSSLATSAPASYAPQATEAPVPTVPPKRSFSLCAAGNIEWNSSVRKTLTIDNAYQFGILTDQITGELSADLSIATLEHTLCPSEKLTDVNMPPEMLTPLKSAGVNTVILGHENILNAGCEGLKETAAAVRSAGLTPIGAYASPQERSTLSLMNLNGVSVAVLHYLDEVSQTGRRQASENEIVSSVAVLDPAVVQQDIAAAKQAGAQVVVLSLRWGKSGASSPTDAQIEQAQAWADAGADIILGTGTGVLQPVKVLRANRADGKYHPVLCAYSLGNLFSHDRESRTTLASILLKANVVYDSANDTVAFENLSYTPTYAWRGKEGSRTLVRVLLNDNLHYPAFVNKDQKGIMERCYKLVDEAMKDTGIPMAK